VLSKAIQNSGDLPAASWVKK